MYSKPLTDKQVKEVYEVVVSGNTGMFAVENVEEDADKGIYTLTGVKVSEPLARGIYIVNGKKVFKK